MTVNVADAEAPGKIDSEPEDSVPVHPDGTTLVRSKVDAAQVVVSLFVTDSVNGTDVPAATAAPCDGEKLTVGFAAMQRELETT